MTTRQKKQISAPVMKPLVAYGPGETPNDQDDTPPPGEDTGAPASEGAKPSDTPMIPKARLDAEISKRSALETEVKAARDAILSGVPEKVRALAPKDGTITELTAWIAAAKDAGVMTAKADVPATSPRPATGARDQDLSNLPTTARMAHGYGSMSSK